MSGGWWPVAVANHRSFVELALLGLELKFTPELDVEGAQHSGAATYQAHCQLLALA